MTDRAELARRIASLFGDGGGQPDRIVAGKVTAIDDYGNAVVDLGQGEQTVASLGSSTATGNQVRVLIDGDGGATVLADETDPPDNSIARAAQGRLNEIDAIAEQAGKTLAAMLEDAAEAGRAVQEVKASAESALSSAAAAEAGLGRVIDVVGVLDWVEGHARLTSDTSAVDGKDYYSRDAATGTMSTADPSGMYAPTADQTVDPSKTYYERTGAEEGPDAYTEVAEPADSEIGSYYERGNPALLGLYELDESVQRYVMSYLALVDGVLKLSSGGTARVELSADALRFVAPDGNVAASVEVGEDGRSVMRITRSVALEDVQFGDWKFYQRANGNMAIKWMGAR